MKQQGRILHSNSTTVIDRYDEEPNETLCCCLCDWRHATIEKCVLSSAIVPRSLTQYRLDYLVD